MVDHHADNDLEFYSKRIRLLRKLLPLLALALLAVLVLVANPDLRRAISGSPTQSDRLMIAEPNFLGRLKDGRPFEMTARKGRQKADGLIAMQEADLTLDGDNAEGRIALSAQQADFAPETAIARLRGDVKMRDAQGNIATSDVMQADLEAGILRASSVNMSGPTGKLTARRMQADTKTQNYRFQGAVIRLKRTAK